MKRTAPPALFSIALLVLVFVVTACTFGYDPFDPPAARTTPAPTDWMTITGDYPTLEATPVAAERIPAHHLILPTNQYRAMLKPLSDGGCLSLSTVPADPADTTGTSGSYLHAIRFAADGAKKWEKTYGTESFLGYPVAMCVFSDNGFAVSLRVMTNSSGTDATDRLLRFSSDGQAMGAQQAQDFTTGSLDYLFATPDDAILAAGTIPSTRTGEPVNNDVALCRIEKDGSLSQTTSLGSSGYDSLMDASFEPSTGLVLVWRTESSDASSAESASFLTTSMASCFDADLAASWTRAMPTDLSLFNVQALPDGAGAYFTGTTLSTGTGGTTRSLSTLLYLDGSGILQWNHTLDAEGAWILGVARLPDGRTIEAGSRGSSPGVSTVCFLTVLSASGQVQQNLDPLPGAFEWIVGTQDGGFTIVSRQSLRALPQPPQISSIWIDTEAYVAHYGSDLKLVWQRSVDQFKNDVRIDILLPTVDDRLLIG